MSGSSANGSWIYIDDNAFEADYPVSTAHAYTARQNVAHLIDSAGQYRVSWLGKSGRTDELAIASGPHDSEPFWSMPFPLTMLNQDGITGLFTRVGIRTSGGDGVTANVRYVWDSEPVDSPSAHVLHSWSDSTTNSTGEWVEDVKLGVDTRVILPGLRTFRIEEGGTDHTTTLYMARIEIKLESLTSDDGALLGVQVIEFPIW